MSLLLQLAVIYIPFLQQAFSTVSLAAGDWLLCLTVASSVLWLRELSKLIRWPKATGGCGELTLDLGYQARGSSADPVHYEEVETELRDEARNYRGEKVTELKQYRIAKVSLHRQDWHADRIVILGVKAHDLVLESQPYGYD